MGLADTSNKAYKSSQEHTTTSKTDRFKLDEELNNALTLDPNLADYTNKYIQNVISDQTLPEAGLSKKHNSY